MTGTTTAVRAGFLAMAWGVVGCSSTPSTGELIGSATLLGDGGPAPHSAGLVAELDHVAQLTSPWPWIYVLIVAAITWSAVHMIDLMMVVAMRRGWQLPLRRAYVGLLLQCLAIGAGLLVALRPFFALAPALTTLLCAAALAVVASVFRDTLQSIVAGLGMTTRGRLHLGDRVDVDGVSGVVRQFGLTHTRLRSADASTLWIPNRLLAQNTVVVGGVKNASRVRTELGNAVRVRDDESRVRVQKLAQISPFRRARSPVSVTATTEGQLAIELQTWATRDVDGVSLRLRRAIERGCHRSHDLEASPDESQPESLA